MSNYTNLDLLKMRLYNNGLIDKFESADMCVESLIGIQCQYQTYALISIYNRTKYKCNIFTNNNLIKSWGQRTTLHIYHKNDYNVISDLYRQSDNWVYKYAKYLKIDYHKYLKSITNFFNKNNKSIMEKTEVQNIIPKYKSKEIMEWSGLLILATYHKVLYGILNESDKKVYKQNDIFDSKNNTSDLIYRYFKYYGPATRQDFLHWSGLKYKEIKEELDKYIEKAKYISIDNKKYYYESLPDLKKVKISYPVILGKFDPLLISYADKEWILNGKNKTLIWKAAGQIEGVILFSKGLKGTWHYNLKGNKIIFEINEISPFTNGEKSKLEKKLVKLGKEIFKKEIVAVYQGGK